MPTYLLRVSRDEPAEYVAWSTVVDAPVTVGMTRDEAVSYLTHEARCAEECCQQKQIWDRLDRADCTGTSSVDGFYGYDDSDLIVEQRGLLPRECIALYANAKTRSSSDDPLTYLQPFEDEVFGGAS